jgi:hypothetical protein
MQEVNNRLEVKHASLSRAACYMITKYMPRLL